MLTHCLLLVRFCIIKNKCILFKLTIKQLSNYQTTLELNVLAYLQTETFTIFSKICGGKYFFSQKVEDSFLKFSAVNRYT